MLEKELVNIVERDLKKLFGPAIYLNKNHGNQFVTRGRPDLEGNIFGRHFGFELKCKTKFTRYQIVHLKRIHKSGGIAGGIKYHKGKIYFMTLSDVIQNKFHREIGRKEIDFKFLYKYLHQFYNNYHGEEDVPKS